MFWLRYSAILILIASAVIGFFVWVTTGGGGRFDFKLGLDLSGGTHLVYRADTSKLKSEDIADSLGTLREVIERRVNAFGVGEPVVETEQGGALGQGEHRLVVELPGVTDIEEATAMIGRTPLLEFKLVKKEFEKNVSDEHGDPTPGAFDDTGLTGSYITRAALEFGGGGTLQQPTVRVDFNTEGSRFFADLTGNNVGRYIAIFLDGRVISAPVVRERIDGGSAVISGNFTAESARELVRGLNLGALPVPIELQSTQTIGAILVVLMLALFKLIPVVLTAAGIAAFILSVGLAVDANILIAERIKEELAAGKKAESAIREGFARAWLAIRDSNFAHIIAAVILFWFGTSLIKGFALVFGIGVLVSMLSAITISRTFLLALGINAEKPFGRFLLKSGFTSR